MLALLKILFSTAPGAIMLGVVILTLSYALWKNLKGFSPVHADIMTDAGIAAFGSVADNLRNKK